MSLITQGVAQTNVKEMQFNLDKHIHECIISSLSLHKALTRCEDPPSYLDISIPNLNWSCSRALIAAVAYGFSLLF